MNLYLNPYWGADFFQFFAIFFQRLFSLSFLSPEADEIQLGVLALTALSCGLIAPFLVLKKMTMFANALSHTLLFGIVTAFLISSSLWGGAFFDSFTLFLGAFVAAFLTAFLTEGAVRLFRLQEEGSVGLIFSLLFALGVILATLFTKNVHLGVEAVLGNIDALQIKDLTFVGIWSCIHLILIPLLFRPLQIAAFDKSFAANLWSAPYLFHFLLLFLTAGVCVSAFRAVGVLLVLSFLTGPYLIARLFCHRLSHLLFLSASIGIILSIFGVALSRHCLSYYQLPLSTGGIVVTLIGCTYLICICFSQIRVRKKPNFGHGHGHAHGHDGKDP